jgi:Fic family protein
MIHIKKLDKLPPNRKEVETLAILRQLSKSSTALGELKGTAKTIPNQEMLINSVVLQEAKDSSEIENIITTQDELYKFINWNRRAYRVFDDCLYLAVVLNIKFRLPKCDSCI